MFNNIYFSLPTFTRRVLVIRGPLGSMGTSLDNRSKQLISAGTAESAVRPIRWDVYGTGGRVDYDSVGNHGDGWTCDFYRGKWVEGLIIFTNFWQSWSKNAKTLQLNKWQITKWNKWLRNSEGIRNHGRCVPEYYRFASVILS